MLKKAFTAFYCVLLLKQKNKNYILWLVFPGEMRLH